MARRHAPAGTTSVRVVSASVMIAGVRVGHWTDSVARTGCTAILLPEGATASGEVRGGAPATREYELLAPHRTVEHVDAFVLAGGSAFGLAACDGVLRWLEEHGRGFPTPAGRVPIVVGAALFDLAVGDASVRPGPDEGYAACEAAREGEPPTGQVGAGTGATVGKWRGAEHARPGGLGAALEEAGGVRVAAIVAVNAIGDLREGVGDHSAALAEAALPTSPVESTTIGAIVTDARLSKSDCLLVAQSGHDGLARALEPAHTAFDGDAIAAASCGSVEVQPDLVRMLAARAVERAIRSMLELPAP
jgi:L-aminopeptidase/D-esterase-like protein